MLSAKLTDRDEELSELREMFARTQGSSGHVALITGAVGSGKTALLNQFANETAGEGALLLDATASHGDDDLSFGVLRRMLVDAPLSVAARTEAERLLEARTTTSGLAGSPTEAISQLATTLLRSVEDRALVIAVDDVHHSDPASLRFLLHMARRIHHQRVLMVFTDASRRGDSLARYRSELAQQPHYRRIRLRLLSRAGMQEMLADRLSPAAAARLSGDLHEATGGNPLLVRALLTDYQATAETEGTPLKVVRAETYDEALLDCLHRCGAESLAVARALAVLGDRSSSSLLARVLGTSVRCIQMALCTLDLCGVVQDGRFRDPEALGTIYDSTPASVLAELHQDAAALLHQEGASATEVARHLLRGPARHEAWTAPVLREAAEHALVAGDTTQARRCLEAALEAAVDERARATIRLRLAGVLWRTLPTAAEKHFAELTTDMAGGLLSPVEAVASLSQLAWAGRVEQAAELAERLREAQPWGPTRTDRLTGARSWLAMLSPRLRERLAAADAAGAAEDAALADDPYFHAAGAVAESLTNGATDKALFVLQRYQLNDTTVQPLVFALWALVYAERLDLADDWSRRLLTECSGTHAPSWQALLISVRAEVDLRRSRLNSADHLANTGLRGMSLRSWGLGVGFPVAIRVEALTGMGRYDEALAMLSRPVPDEMLDTLPGLHYRRARGRLYLATNRHHAALGDFLACGELVERWGADAPALVPWRTDAAEAWLALGQPQRAAALAEEQLKLTPARLRQLRGMTLRVLGMATRDTAARTAALHESVELLEGGEGPLQLALALGELGDVHHAKGDFGRARMLTRRAWHLAKSCAAEPVCRRLAPQSPEGGHVEAGPEDEMSQGNDTLLSEAENRVAVLAAQGLTNREISAKLYITVSTVEQHLTRIYRKLSVKRRRDLPTALAELTQVAS
ncbi:AAA family ATPase [Streptomyces sp. NPDC053431]|uniref:helix-turn-helix transcriptional regulator n=1 Tax=Streptomyces sp. NPDC053431 TaxID=3365703 RepID=UPI0037CF94B7